MTDELLPPGKLERHNAFGHEAVRSAVEAVDDLIADRIGERVDAGLRADIEERIVAAWKETTANGWRRRSRQADRLRHRRHRFISVQPKKICNAILASTEHDVTNDIGVPIANDVNRALVNLTEGLMNIHRDVIIQLGFHPDGLNPLDGK